MAISNHHLHSQFLQTLRCHRIARSRSIGRRGRTARIVAAARKAIEGVSDELNAMAMGNLDLAQSRRRVRESFVDIQQNLDHFLFKQVKGLPHFLLGQSMGGAVALKVHLKQPKEWDGVLLAAPTCKIAADVTPPGPVLSMLTLMSYILPEAKLFPQKDIGDLAFRDPMKRKMAEYNVISYSNQMRLKTAVELIKATQDIESQRYKVSSPLLILHGAADKVTDPKVSKFLYDTASTEDKTLKLYAGSYHSILEGEPDDRIATVIDDIISWLDSHS